MNISVCFYVVLIINIKYYEVLHNFLGVEQFSLFWNYRYGLIDVYSFHLRKQVKNLRLILWK